MANKYDRWVGTQAVHMPVDAYQQLAVYKEKEAEESLNRIKAVTDTYAGIKPASKDAEAFYNETINDLRSKVAEVTKMDLGSPEAMRKINGLISDPNTTGNLEKVYQDAQYMTKAQAAIDKAIEEGNETNATHLRYAINNTMLEKGDAKAFKYDRFKNLGPVAKYQDVNKVIDGIAGQMKAQKLSTTVIRNGKVITTTTEKLTEKELREMALQRAYSDPLLKAQMGRNLDYMKYQVNPYNSKEATATMGEAYKKSFADRIQQQVDYMAKYATGKTKKQLEHDKDYQQMQMLHQSYLNEIAKLPKDDDELVEYVFKDAFSKNFDSYRVDNREYKEARDPLEIVMATQDRIDRRMREKAAMKKKLVDSFLNAPSLSVDGNREQDAITPSGFRDYVKEKIPALNGIKIDKTGAIDLEHADLVSHNGKYYLPQDVTTSWVKGGSTSRKVVTVKPGAQPMNKDNYKKYVQNTLSKVLEDSGIDDEYDLSTSGGMQKALQDIVNNTRDVETSYSPIFTMPAGETETYRKQVAANLRYVGAFKNGQKVEDADLGTLQNLLNDKKKDITVQLSPVNRDGKSYNLITIDGNEYKIPLHNELSAYWKNANNRLKRFTENNHKPTIEGDNLLVSGMAKGGGFSNGVIVGGGTKEYQTKAGGIYNDMVSTLMKNGLKKESAEKLLNSKYNEIIAHMQKQEAEGKSSPFTITVNGKPVLDVITPVRKRDGVFYSESNITGKNAVVPYSQFLHGEVNEFVSGNNPWMRQMLFEKASSKIKDNLLFGDDEDEDDATDNQLMTDPLFGGL